MSAPTHQQTWITHVCSSCCFCSAYLTHLSLLLLRSCRWCLSLDLDRDRRECLLRLLSLSLDLDLDLRGMSVKSSAQDQESMPMLHCAERHGVKTLKTGTMATHAAELSSTFTRVRNHSPTRLCTQRGRHVTKLEVLSLLWGSARHGTCQRVGYLLCVGL